MIAGLARAVVALSLCLVIGLMVPAQAQGLASQADVVPGERLSDWLLRQFGPDADTSALHWRVPAERTAQDRLRRATLQALRNEPGIRLSPAQRETLADWLLALPLTGRLTVALPDARWLQGAPSQDPVLQAGQTVSLYPRPSQVAVLTESGRPCLVKHRTGARVPDYLQACSDVGLPAQADWAWLTQSDGRTVRLGVARWNLDEQDEPSAGAWIWAPGRQASLPNSLSDNLARFLATQAPAEYVASLGETPGRNMAPVLQPVPRPGQLSASDWGEIGLLQTPTARMAPAGSVRLRISQIDPYTHGNIMLQPLDWLEGGFRYTDVSNRLYGPEIAGSQTYKDKSIDFKLRLLEESDSWPQLALGVRDIGGTGLFSGEYLVASKRWGNWDASLGLGWGYLGARGNVANPLCLVFGSFKSRPVNDVGQGGTPSLQTWFHGPAALFGGLQWHTPHDPLLLKFELDGNDYQREPQDNRQTATSPFNVGAVYRYSPSVDLHMGIERGNRLMLGLTLHGGLHQLDSPKLLDPKLPPARAIRPVQPQANGWADTAAALERFTGWQVRRVEEEGNSVTVLADADAATYLQERIDRAIDVLNRDAPAGALWFKLQLQDHGLPMTQIDVNRADWLAQRLYAVPPSQRVPDQQARNFTGVADASPTDLSDPSIWIGPEQKFNQQWGPSFSHILGGPDSFLLYQLGVQSFQEYRFSDSTWISSRINLRLLDNYEGFKYDAPSDLPRVRTYQREYAISSRLTLPLLQLTHVQDLGAGHYASAYAGMLESMYGGAGAEWLYRPWHSRVAVGMDVNHVRQRDFRQNLAFRDYSVNTGHATLYWDTGWNGVQLNLSAGRYLAGDWGGTLSASRTFANGVTMGGWATKTDVSAEQFGEGSFDKGLYIAFPLDAILPKSTSLTGLVAWNPLTRDGGARLGRSVALYDVTQLRDPRARTWRPAAKTAMRSAEDLYQVSHEPDPNALERLVDSTAKLGRQINDIPGSTWAWGAGAIVAASLFDNRVDNWAQAHQGGTMERLGKAGTAVPIAMGLGTALLYTGLGGEPAASTADISLKAAGLTLGANLITRFTVGRARPFEGKGSGSFEGFGSDSAQSGFASNHVALAFALATPFAQEHNMPWLYAVAASTALGRVQQREHWLSDTVAGAMMGYAIGSMLTDQEHDRSGIRLSLSPQAVTAHWSFK
ncbi:MAG: YjbH domain-containing protein [Betaproteobacteria bacterium]